MKRTCYVTGIVFLALMYLQAIAGDMIPSKYIGTWEVIILFLTIWHLWEVRQFILMQMVREQ
jgi:hypothetical protein